MGNTTNLAYDILEPVAYDCGIPWSLHNGNKKEEVEPGKRSKVSIFRLMKAGNSPELLALAQRNVQKLRTIKHPFILTYVDSTEMEDCILLVTESCVPLAQWLKKLSSEADPSIPKSNVFFELTWGFKCLLQALDFVHSQCAMVHGHLSPSSVFITPSGDWKLAGFDHASSINSDADVVTFKKFQHLIESAYLSPERRDADQGKLRQQSPPYYLDIFSFGKCIEHAFSATNTEIEGGFSRYVSLMVHQEVKKRPTAKKLLTAKTFTSDYIKIMENIQEFNIKGPKEILEVMSQLDTLLPQMTVALCSYKLLPNLCRVLQRAVADFQIRDSRETARQSIIAAMEMLSKLAALQKLEQSAFDSHYRELIAQLWAMSDRSVRTVLLMTLKNMVDFIPEASINKSIFDHMVAGFADSNAKMRESTLMSLIYIVDKLDELHMQDRLVRCVMNLQNDPEASIRTNTVIFVGKIAHKLKEAVRIRVLCSALTKAMKDSFVHCRIAALRTSLAVGKLLDVPQVAGKVMPQASMLCLDKHPEVRNLSIALIESSLELIKSYHTKLAEERSNADGNKEDLSNPQSSATSGTDYLGSSWSLLQNISKTFDKPTASPSSSSNLAVSSPISTPKAVSDQKVLLSPPTTPQPAFGMKKAAKPEQAALIDEDDEMDFDQHIAETSSKLSEMDFESDNKWEDDDLDDILKGDDLALSYLTSPHSHKNSNSNGEVSKVSKSGIATNKSERSVKDKDNADNDSAAASKAALKGTSIAALSKAKPVKGAVKKLEVKKDDWDDF